MKYEDEVKALRAMLAPNAATITLLLMTQTIDTLTNAELDRSRVVGMLNGQLADLKQATLSVASEQCKLGAAVTAQNQDVNGLQIKGDYIPNTIDEVSVADGLIFDEQHQDCLESLSSIDGRRRIEDVQDEKGALPVRSARILRPTSIPAEQLILAHAGFWGLPAETTDSWTRYNSYTKL